MDSTSRNFYWQKLQEEIYRFLEDFDNHMEEEESIFQPLLNEHFTWDELVKIKDQVLAQHSDFQGRVDTEKSLKNLKRGRVEDDRLSEERPEKSIRVESPAASVPREVLIQVLSYLDDPRDLAQAAQVCASWDSACTDPSLWRSLNLSQWEKGMWQFSEVDVSTLLLSCALEPRHETPPEPCPLYDRLSSTLLPSIGHHVRHLSLSDSRNVSMKQVSSLLEQMPGLRSLDLSYTSLSTPALGSPSTRLPNLTKLNLSGCPFVTDDFIERLVSVLGPCSKLKWLSLSGCEQLTDAALPSLSSISTSLDYFDYSGCYRYKLTDLTRMFTFHHRLSGDALKKFSGGCKTLNPEDISYCSNIQVAVPWD